MYAGQRPPPRPDRRHERVRARPLTGALGQEKAPIGSTRLRPKSSSVPLSPKGVDPIRRATTERVAHRRRDHGAGRVDRGRERSDGSPHAAEGAQGERHARYSSHRTSSSPHARLEPHGSLWLMRGFPRDMFCRRLGVGATRGPGDGSPSAPGASTVVSMGHSVRIDGRTAPGTRSRTPASPPISPPSAMFRPPLPRRYADFVFYTRAPTHPLTH